jgi:hypothetical protein
VQAFEGSRRYAADPRNPWVYAHTSRDVFEITARVVELSHLLQRAPIVLLTPDQEPALLKALYELPPPGERDLYVSLFDRPLELRPGVEMRGYVANRLLEESLRQ